MDLSEIIKNMNSSDRLNINLPQIEMPIKEEDCPAAPVCEAIGNLRKSCVKGSSALTNPDLNTCLASVILLISMASGMWPNEKLEELQKKRGIGFLADDYHNQPGRGASA